MRRQRTTIAPQIIDEASEWFVAMREPNASAELRAGFSEWLRASPVHLGVYLEIAQLWGDAADISPELAASAPPSSQNVFSLPLSLRERGRGEGSSAPRRYAIAASILIGIAVSGLLSWQHFSTPTFSTAVGEQRTLTLEDGSIVKLNARSKLRIRMEPQARQVELIDGQALFEVAQDPQRPFIVSSGNASIRALGTQFDVYRKRNGTLVTVLEGKVSVSSSSSLATEERPSARESSLLTAGQQARVSQAGTIDLPAKPNVTAATSWLQQELIFDGQPLGAVIDEFNRYSKTPIVLADPSLVELRVNAVFHTTSPDALLRFVGRLDGIQIDQTRSEIRITRAR